MAYGSRGPSADAASGQPSATEAGSAPDAPEDPTDGPGPDPAAGPGGSTGTDARARPPADFAVLVVGPTHGGGIVSYIAEQTRRLEDRVDLTVHDSGAPPTGSGPVRVVQALVLGVVALVRFALRSPPDLVHVHTSHRFSFYRKGLYVLFSRYVWDAPVVLHVHGSGFDEFVRTDSRPVAAYQRSVFDACDRIVVLSPSWKDVVATRADEGKIEVLPNAVDLDNYEADPTDDRAHVVFVSNLIERKGVADLAAAVEELDRRRPGEFRVSIAGDGPLSDVIEELAAEHDAVTYHGYVSEERKQRLLAEGSIYVLPTYAEGLPIAMLEGMAAGNAVVSTAVAAIPEVVDEDRGILVEPGDVEALIDALKELVADPDRRRRLAVNNRRAVEAEYSWERVTEELLDLYAEYA